MSGLLEFQRANKSFGTVRVIHDLTYEVARGEALGVVGPNGAGKTTMMNLVAGTLRLDSGTVMFDGGDVTRMPAHRRCRAGIARTHQVPQPFESLTVFENVLVGARFGGASGSDAVAATARHVGRVGLAPKANVLAATLTLLERKRLELARALATSPRLLLLDEIGGGLTEAELTELVQTIRELRASGLTIVWIEHIVHALLSVVDRLIAIDFGKMLIEGPPTSVMSSPEVQAIYMGVEDL